MLGHFCQKSIISLVDLYGLGCVFSYVTLDHKTSHKGKLFEIEMYTLPESWINIWLRYNYLKNCNLRVQKNLNIEKIAFKDVQIKFLANAYY